MHLIHALLKKSFCCFVFMMSAVLFSQEQKELDSLLIQLEKITTKDSIRAQLLITTSNNFVRKDLAKSYELVEEALNISTGIKWKKGVVLALRQMGVVYYRQGNIVKATEQWYKALEILKTIKNSALLESSIYNNLANIYSDSGEFDKALTYYNKLLSISEKLDNKPSQIIALTNIGTLLTERETSIDNGIVSLEKALALAREVGNDRYELSILLNIGLAYKRKKDYQKAEFYYLKVQELAEQSNDTYVQVLVFNNLSNISILKPDYAQGEIYANKTLSLAKEIGAVEWEAYAWENLSNIYESRNQNKKALTYYKNHIKLIDSFNAMQNKEELASLEAKHKYNLEKQLLNTAHEKKQLVAEEEINRQKLIKNTTLLVGFIVLIASIIGVTLFRRKQLAVAKAKEIELKNKVTDTELKVLRAQMNPHFIFNSLNSINSYIVKNDTESATNYLTKFSKLVRKTLESSTEKEVLLKDDIEILKNYLDIENKRLNNSFTYSIKVDDAIDAGNTLIPPLIFQPFLENSIWHGIAQMERSGHISVEFKKENNVLFCIVDDNGVGRKQAIKVAKENTSLGINLTKNRIDIINAQNKTKGSLRIIDKEQGVRVEVKLPLKLAF
ncbi:tetratricopeptide repeat protein [Algibacter amylolyticus]|uniref:Tetratricopeptide repeat protein n=1 Tax=Algibacter amylolyticus TaxID=1608400 RepID=A0A5M7BGN9_9FLAO|nr:tetratricopeptide repeat protein [Algibacter amylolyticus]KAA5827638.1 tetratricopeptide repeat protein [Algibacter amylolyticus]MBB5266851.1 tetratricopeptide (TPR) repeat protein [Algibacter amylolyticus]TSJ81883.1 tetratricopeptide repeat protein [Algibacter amylolyticus]